MDAIRPTPHTTLERHPERGSFDSELIFAILDEALVCHVAFVFGGRPFVLPTAHVRVGGTLYLHGSKKSRMLEALSSGARACLCVTLLDGLVLGRSAMHHSMNYRSVMILAQGRDVTGREEKLEALRALVEHVRPGRFAVVRGPSDAELSATRVVAFPISEASAKVRTGPPLDAAHDLGWPCWAGVVPLTLSEGVPEPDRAGA